MLKFFSSKYLGVKNLFASFLIVGLLFSATPIAQASNFEQLEIVQNVTDNTVVTINNSVHSEYFNNDLVTPQSIIINNGALDIDIYSKGPTIFADWTYKSSLNNKTGIGYITSVSLTMTLQYREDFLHSWEDVETTQFIYAGGQGFTEENQDSFWSTREGTYRVVMSGTVTGTTGFTTVASKASKSIKVTEIVDVWT